VAVRNTVDPSAAWTTSFSPLSFGGTRGDVAALPLHVNSFTQGAHGTVTRSGDTLIYQPVQFYVGADSFQYNVIDSNSTGGRTSAFATINVTVSRTMHFSTDVQTALGAAPGAGCLVSCHGSTGTAPKHWTSWADIKTVINDPSTAASSKILVYPPTAGHGGGSPQAGWTLNGTFGSAFKTVQRWIEEGGANN
jgi:hypothetical protein